MKPEWLQTMMAAISEVLETMFFTMVDFGGQGNPAGYMYYESEIQLTDVEEITIRFRVVGEFARVLTANFLGSDEAEVKVEEVEDAMKELVNMVAGYFQPRIAEKKWRLGIPCFRMSGYPAPEEKADPAGSSLDLQLLYMGEPVGMVTLESRNERI